MKGWALAGMTLKIGVARDEDERAVERKVESNINQPQLAEEDEDGNNH